MFYTINGVAQDAIMIIVAIDPGIKNLGWSVYDTNQCRFKSFGRYNLLKDQPKAMHTKYPQLVHGFITASKAVFDVADIVVIEIQIDTFTFETFEVS